MFFNKNIIKRLELIEKSMGKLIRTTDKKIIILKMMK